MRSRVSTFRVLALSLSLLLLVTISGNATGTDGATQAAPDLKGTWSGTFFSKHDNVPAFTMTVVINPDAQRHLTASASLNSDCLHDVQLEVTVAGSIVTLSGSDEDGNNITVRGTLDSTGTMLKAKFILNGSATGKCEADTGKGDLAKR